MAFIRYMNQHTTPLQQNEVNELLVKIQFWKVSNAPLICKASLGLWSLRNSAGLTLMTLRSASQP